MWVPATIEIKNIQRGGFLLNFGDIELIEAPQLIKKDLLLSDFSYPIGSCRLNAVVLVEEILLDLSSVDRSLNLQQVLVINRNPFEGKKHGW